jgi:Cof subfamily protein (haloacid dehalogenase superfamily)
VKSFNSHWKAIACDLDGTLIGRDHKIIERDLDALRRARAAGIHTAICTGRNTVESGGVISALELSGPGIFVNGAMVGDMSNGKTIHSRYLTTDLAMEVLDFFGGMGHAVLMLIDDAETRMPRYFISDHGPPHRSTMEWLLFNRMEAEFCNGMPEEHKHRVVRLGIIVNSPEQPEVTAAMQNTFEGRSWSHAMYSAYFDCWVLELFSHGTSKWSGVQYMAQAMGCRDDQVITIGDEINDVEMLQGAKLSFAMGNARPEIQRQAKRVTLPQMECGVAAVIDDLLAGRLEPGA